MTKTFIFHKINNKDKAKMQKSIPMKKWKERYLMMMHMLFQNL